LKHAQERQHPLARELLGGAAGAAIESVVRERQQQQLRRLARGGQRGSEASSMLRAHELIAGAMNDEGSW
jgi:hypothetical protein